MNKPTALVSGASGGIGEDLARELAQRGHNLILVARSADKLETLGAELRAKHAIQTTVISQDLAHPDAAQQLFAELEQRQLKIDVLVNNAGFADFGEFWTLDTNKQAQMIQLNITTLTLLTRLLLPAMVAQKSGSILNVASTAAFMPGPLMAVYYASKAFVLSFGEALGEELRQTGVSVTTLCPGPVKSGFQARAAMQDSKLLNNPMNPLMESQDVAKQAIEAMTRKQRVVIPGFNNQLIALMPRFVPRALLPAIVKNAQARAH